MSKQSDSTSLDLSLGSCDQKQEAVRPARWGDLCPQCGQGNLDYNGLLELECPVCHFRDASIASYT